MQTDKPDETASGSSSDPSTNFTLEQLSRVLATQHQQILKINREYFKRQFLSSFFSRTIKDITMKFGQNQKILTT